MVGWPLGGTVCVGRQTEPELPRPSVIIWQVSVDGQSMGTRRRPTLSGAIRQAIAGCLRHRVTRPITHHGRVIATRGGTTANSKKASEECGLIHRTSHRVASLEINGTFDGAHGD